MDCNDGADCIDSANCNKCLQQVQHNVTMSTLFCLWSIWTKPFTVIFSMQSEPSSIQLKINLRILSNNIYVGNVDEFHLALPRHDRYRRLTQ